MRFGLFDIKRENEPGEPSGAPPPANEPPPPSNEPEIVVPDVATKAELQELRDRLAHHVKRVNRAVKQNRAQNPPPANEPPPPPLPGPKPTVQRGALHGLLGGMRKRRPSDDQ